MQVWATRAEPSLSAGYGLSLGIRLLSPSCNGWSPLARHSHLLLRLEDAGWEGTAAGWEPADVEAYASGSGQVVEAYRVVALPGMDAATWFYAGAMRGRPYGFRRLARFAAWKLTGSGSVFADGGRGEPVCSTGVALAYLLGGGIDLAGAVGVPAWRWAPGHMWRLSRRRPDLVKYLGRVA